MPRGIENSNVINVLMKLDATDVTRGSSTITQQLENNREKFTQLGDNASKSFTELFNKLRQSTGASKQFDIELKKLYQNLVGLANVAPEMMPKDVTKRLESSRQRMIGLSLALEKGTAEERNLNKETREISALQDKFRARVDALSGTISGKALIALSKLRIESYKITEAHHKGSISSKTYLSNLKRLNTGIEELSLSTIKGTKQYEKFNKEEIRAKDAIKRFNKVVEHSREELGSKYNPVINNTIKRMELLDKQVKTGQIGTNDFAKGIGKLSNELIQLQASTKDETAELRQMNRELERATSIRSQFKDLTKQKGLGIKGQQTLNSLLGSQGDYATQLSKVAPSVSPELFNKARKEYSHIIEEFRILNKEFDKGKRNPQEYARRVTSLTKELTSLRLAMRGNEKDLERLSKSTRTTSRETKELGHSFGILDNKAGDVIRQGGRTTGLLRTFSRLRNRILVATFALAGLVRGMVRFVKISAESEKQMLALGVVAKNTGNSTNEVQKAVNSLAQDGILSLEGAAQAMKNLLSTGADLSIVVENLEAMKEAAVANGRAAFTAEENIIAYTQGIKEQKSQLTDSAGIMTNLSAVMKRYADIIANVGQANGILIGFTKEAKEQFAGALEPVIHSLSGQMQILGVQADVTRKILGRKLLPVASVLVAESIKANEALQSWADTTSNSLTPSLELMISIIRSLNKVASTFISGISPFISFLNEGLRSFIKIGRSLNNMLKSLTGGSKEASNLLYSFAKFSIVVLIMRRINMAIGNIITNMQLWMAARNVSNIQSFIRALFSLQNVFTLVTSAVVLLGAAYIKHRNAQIKAREEQENLRRAAELTNLSLDKQAQLLDRVQKFQKDVAAKTSKEYLTHLKELNSLKEEMQSILDEDAVKSKFSLKDILFGAIDFDRLDEIKQKIKDLKNSQIQKEIDEWNKSFAENGRELTFVTNKLGDVVLGFKYLKKNVDGTTSVIKEAIDEFNTIDSAGGRINKVRVDMQKVGKQAETLKKKIQEARKELELLGKEGIAALAINLRHGIKSALDDYDKLIEANKELLSRMKPVQEELDKQSSTQKKLLSLQEELDKLTKGLAPSAWEKPTEKMKNLSRKIDNLQKNIKITTEGVKDFVTSIKLSTSAFVENSEIAVQTYKTELEGRLAVKNALQEAIDKQKEWTKAKVRDMKISQIEISSTIKQFELLEEKSGKSFDPQIKKLKELRTTLSNLQKDYENASPKLVGNEIKKFVENQITVTDNFEDVMKERERLNDILIKTLGEGSDAYNKASAILNETVGKKLVESSGQIFDKQLNDQFSSLKNTIDTIQEALISRKNINFLDSFLGLEPTDMEKRKVKLERMKQDIIIQSQMISDAIDKLPDVSDSIKDKLKAALGQSKKNVLQEISDAFLQNAKTAKTWKEQLNESLASIGNSFDTLASTAINAFANMKKGISDDVFKMKTDYIIQMQALEEANQNQEISNEELVANKQALTERFIALEKVVTAERKAEAQRQLATTMWQLGMESAANAVFSLIKGEFFKAAAFTAFAIAMGVSSNQFTQAARGNERYAAVERARIERKYQRDIGQSSTTSTSQSGGSFGKTVSAQPMNVTISPSITIQGELIGIGLGGVDALSDTLGEMIIDTVNEAVETGELNVQA